MPTISVWAERSGCIKRRRARSVTAARLPRFQMRWSGCWAVIWPNAILAKTYAGSSRGTAIQNFANTSQDKPSPRLPVISLKIWLNRQEDSVTSLFPMFLKLENKHCLVAGAGKVGEPKVAGLLDTGARIRVVALDASPAVREWAKAGKIELELRPF